MKGIEDNKAFFCMQISVRAKGTRNRDGMFRKGPSFELGSWQGFLVPRLISFPEKGNETVNKRMRRQLLW